MAINRIRRPTSFEAFITLCEAGTPSLQTTCLSCRQAFSPSNVHTTPGWAETQISGFCEDCFDALFPEEDDNDRQDD